MAKKTAVALQEELKKLGVELTGDESYKQLEALLKKAEKSGGAKAGATGTDEKSPVEKPTGTLFVWLKSRAYVDLAGKTRMNAGLYQMESLEVYPRLQAAKANTAEVFEGEIPPRKLAEIARWAGVNPDQHRKDEELLALLIQIPKTF